ncbi:ABC transporter substrate-binding protein [Rhodoplanes sp. Z2-YC6860]|uniref:ABC transporter substrate-binding protein n=1 Tax=Rhodoplanes sp. Z2-YC6860 TaxID=674703 RepID=UPI00078EA1E7|nr:ABC transporter substrate-binding protein [Rhodoplanes sp. Z2-YC6860]AMN43109.1 ABC transporter substrate binding protein [Rhodoplanes sp. Z2-YC6860]
MLQRRTFITLLGSAAAWPLAARAQQRERMRRIGVLMHLAADDPEGQTRLAAFLQGLQEAGWAVGRNVAVDVRWAAASSELMKRFAGELAALQPDVIFVTSTPGTGAMLQATRTIPVVFVLVADPVGSGYVASLPRPGGNATGFTPIVDTLGGRWAELLKEIAPSTTRVRLLYNPSSASFIDSYAVPYRNAAASHGMESIAAPVDDLAGLEAVFARQASEPNSGVVIFPDAFTERYLTEIVALAVRHRVPAINWSRSFADRGGLISYGPYLVDEHRRAAAYVDRILKGEKPSELPVQAPLKYQLVVNLKTAKALGLTVPQTLLVAADDLIE